MPLAIVRFNQTLYDKYICNVTCWDDVQEDPSWLQDFADALRASANDAWDNIMVAGWTLDDITVSFIDGDHITYSVDVPFTAGDLQGNVLTDGMPGGSPLLISTRYVGPAPNRGRIYFSGLGESNQSAGVWASGAKVALRDMVIAWAAGFSIGGFNPRLQILRRPSAKFPTYVANPVQLVTGTDPVRSQRRRNLPSA